MDQMKQELDFGAAVYVVFWMIIDLQEAAIRLHKDWALKCLN